MTPARALSPTELLVLTPEQAGQLLGISRSKVYELIQAGQLPTITVFSGGPARITRADLDAYVVARKREATEAHANYLTLTAPRGRGQRADTRR
ncbi:helix-turn-helix domain-containing protein [Deinococcus multiflagellatus]|uniref:Helix-turn-helix domain-containing protein n=1 Tax=Deinococcus multiflagellatus TaxID=1656887 RepID=A0ABW1ZH02_9DEIO|nr:helix-turn-helix domain-containing protein [Deinococcus multiflagellatus]MBZ9712227.1 helix-turn-helix domain-containing protein [Deinococcus multiflagellatus]